MNERLRRRVWPGAGVTTERWQRRRAIRASQGRTQMRSDPTRRPRPGRRAAARDRRRDGPPSSKGLDAGSIGSRAKPEIQTEPAKNPEHSSDVDALLPVFELGKEPHAYAGERCEVCLQHADGLALLANGGTKCADIVHFPDREF